MPKDIVDRTMDQIRKRRSAITRPVAIPKKILRKYSLYLPKPPPPKLQVREYPKRCWPDEWTEKIESQGERSQEATPRTIPETERDWFPNVEYQEQPPDDEEDEQEWGSMRDWELEEEQEWGQWEQEQEQEQGQEMEETPEQQNVEVEWDDIEQGQHEFEEEWPQAKEEETHDGHNSGELERDEEWPEEEAMYDGEEDPNQQEEGVVNNQEVVPIPAPKLRPVSTQPTITVPLFVPLNKGKGQPTKGMGKPAMGYPTPLTHPIVAANPNRGGKGAKGKKATWMHPIQNPFHPVHMGHGRVVHAGMPNQWMPNQKGGWTPPPFPAQHQMAPFPYNPGYGQQQMPCSAHEPGWMLPPWMQQSSSQSIGKAVESGYDASEDTDEEETSQYTTVDKKVRKNPKNPKPKRRKYKIWITVNGKRQQASYWK